METQQIWERFGEGLRAFIRRRVNDEATVDDLVQESFVRIHNHLDSLSDEDRLSAWLYRIARNVVYDYYRRRPPSSVEELEPADSADAEQNLNREVGAWLRERIDQLPDGYREAVTLSEIEGVRQTEIAKREGLSPSGAKSRVQRGRRMLKDLLLECCHFEFDRRGNVIDYEARSQCVRCCEASDQRRPAEAD